MILQIPVGARFVGIPGTENAQNPRGIMVEVYWEQDESGSLCISGHSTETPVPPNVEPTPPPLASTSRRSSGRGRVHGFVIDPNLLSNSNY